MKILVVQTGFFGDVVLSTPVLSNLRTLYPDACLCVMTTAEAADLLRSHPSVDRLLIFDKRGQHRGIEGFRAMRRLLVQEKFDIVLGLHKSLRTSLLLFSAGIPLRIGFREAAGSFLYHKRIARRHLGHEALRNLVILEGLGAQLETLDSRLNLGISDAAQEEAAALLASANPDRRPFAGLAPGSVWTTKRWTPSGFASVGDELTAMGYRVVLLGGPKDRTEAEAVERLMEVPPLNLAGRTHFMLSIAVIAALDILVSNDSAPLHIASACGTPVVAAFCATVPQFGFGPWGLPSATVGVPSLSCRPCGRHGGHVCPTGTHACRLQLHGSQVMAAVRRILDESEQGYGRQNVHL
jgi:heptosyltransferase-2